MVLAAGHVAMFVGAAARVDRSAEVPATVEHALLLLIEEAQRQREEWLG